MNAVSILNNIIQKHSDKILNKLPDNEEKLYKMYDNLYLNHSYTFFV